jgi:hypothetical protein
MKYILLLVFIILFFRHDLLLSQQNGIGKLGKKDIVKIKSMMRKELCSDFLNRLYIINNDYALWIRKGDCYDNRYSYTLFGKGVKILCYQRETITGVDKKCNSAHESFFSTMIDNMDKVNLGLNKQMKVSMIYSLK